MKLYCRDQEIEEFHGDDTHYNCASVHLCQIPGDFRCEIRVVSSVSVVDAPIDKDVEIVLWRSECDNELCLDDCVLVKDDEFD